MTPEKFRHGSFAKRVFDVNEADVVFVPFFATMSAEMQLGVAKSLFNKKQGNEDYQRQRQVMDFVKGTEAWKRSGGRDHVFVLTGNGNLLSKSFFFWYWCCFSLISYVIHELILLKLFYFCA